MSPHIAIDREFPIQSSFSASSPIPKCSVDWKLSQNEFEPLVFNYATTTGYAGLENLGIKAPLDAVRRLFDHLYANPSIMEKLNRIYPSRGIVKNASMTKLEKEGIKIDRKVPFDLSYDRIKVLEKHPGLFEQLGDDFPILLDFYSRIEQEVLPRLFDCLSSTIGCDMKALHSDKNFNFRVIDYFPKLKSNDARCGEHRDYGSFTLIFQDEIGGLEVLDSSGSWVSLNAPVVLMWGWCASLLSNDKIVPALHRVIDPDATRSIYVPRRNTAVVFVAPNKNVELHVGKIAPEEVSGANTVTVSGLKEFIAEAWRQREGSN